MLLEEEIYKQFSKKIILEEKSPVKKPPSGFSISSTLDGYDPKVVDPIITEREIKCFEFNVASQAVALIQNRVVETEKNPPPEQTTAILLKKKQELEAQKTIAENNYNAVQESYEILVNGVEEKELKRQVETEKHYFSPSRTQKKDALEIAKHLQANRLANKTQNSKPLKVDNIPTRRLITAEISTIKASLMVYGRPPDKNPYGTNLGWTSVSSIKKKELSHCEDINLGDDLSIKYQQKVHPHYNHVGDYYMDDLGKYKDIFKKINSITSTTDEKTHVENEKRLASYMLRYSKTGQSITLNDLKQIKPEATLDDVKHINRILYHCFVKEIARWMLPKNSENELPFATAQLRAVKLIEKGYLRMEQVFSQFAPYGVFTDKGIVKNIASVKKKIKMINTLYKKTILTPESGSLIKHINFLSQHGMLVTTRKQLHEELKSGYGAGSDTDGEGYDSDTAENMNKQKRL